MNFDHLDDPTPRSGDLTAVTAAARRRTTRRRTGAAAGVLSVALVGGGWALAVRDEGGERDLVTEPATTTTSVAPAGDAVARYTTSEGLEIEMTLPYTQAVPGGPVIAEVRVTNPTDHAVLERARCMSDTPYALRLVRPDGSSVAATELTCGGDNQVLGSGETRVSTLTSNATADPGTGNSEPLTAGEYRVAVISDEIDPGVAPSLPIEIVEPVGHSEVELDATLGAGQVVDPVLVVHNDLDALVPFPGTGETCQWVNDRFVLTMQGQFVAPGAEPAPFAWPGVDCTGLEMRPYPILRPGPNEVAIATVDAPLAPGSYELVVDLGYEWPGAITRPGRVGVTVTPTERPIVEGTGP